MGHAHDHVKDHRDPQDNNPQQESPALVKELHDDLDSGHGRKLWHDLHDHDLEVAQTTVDDKFGPCLIVRDKHHKDKNGNDLTFEVHGDKKIELENGVTIDKDGKIHFEKDGITIDHNGVIKDKNGTVLDDPTGSALGTSAAERSAKVNGAQNVVADVNQQVANAEAKIGNVSPEMLDATKANINEVARTFMQLGMSPPSGLDMAITSLDRAHARLSPGSENDPNGSPVGDARIASTVT
ncbi:MAG TPA: hypothetical protein V6C72_06160 [Chroococcales cyanobacterium]